MIRPTFLGFETARKGINTSQKGLDITGQNLVNWDSDGYTRQRIEQVAASQNAYSGRYGNSRIGVAGQGVDIVGISQLRDTFLDKRYREESSESGYYEKTNVILSDIQDSLDLLDANGDSGLRGRLMSLIDSLDAFAGSPDSPTNANIVSTNVKSMAQTLQLFSQKLDAIAGQQTYDLAVDVNSFNDKLARVAELNRIIMEDTGVIGDDARFQPNELFDERNLLIDELSKMADIQVTNNADGTVNIDVGGQMAVQGKKHDSISMEVDEETSVVSLCWLSSGKNATINSGSIKSYRDYINGRGTNVVNPGETPQRGISYYRDQLDAFANSFAEIMNGTIPQDLEHPEGPYKKLIETVDGSDTLTAGNISISADWAKDPSFIIVKKGDLDSTHLLNLKNKLSSTSHSFTVGDNEVFEGSLLDFLKGMGTTLGSDASYAEGREKASGFIVGSLQDRRDSVSGVNVDEETANMMMYQKSLQAASRLMTTLDEALDVLINRTGMVGR